MADEYGPVLLPGITVPVKDITELQLAKRKLGILPGNKPTLPDNVIDYGKERRQLRSPVVGKVAGPAPTYDVNKLAPGLALKGDSGHLRTFTGADIQCVIHVIGNGGQSQPLIIANAQTISYSVHREKVPVRALGHTYPVGFTRGGRTIGGSIIFTMFDREVLWELIQSYVVDVEWNDDSYQYSSYSPMLDQLPPFDITITFANEYGDVANMALYGVELIDEGTVLSVDDLMVEKTCSFVARDMDMVRPYSDAPNFSALGKDISHKEVTSEDVNAFLNTLKDRRAHINRLDPQGVDSVYRYDIPYDYAVFANAAVHDSKYGIIPARSEVTYVNSAGVIWEGWSNARPDEGPNWYEFIPKLSMYPAWTSNGSFRVHSDKTDPSTGIQYQDVPPTHLLLVGSDGHVMAERSELQPK